MNVIDIVLIITIAIILNIFVHTLSSTIYKDYQYKQKIQNSVTLLIIFGIVCVVGSYYVEQNVISYGLFLGGILLMLTAIIGSWDSVSDVFKIVIAAAVLGLLIWYSYNRSNEQAQIAATPST